MRSRRTVQRSATGTRHTRYDDIDRASADVAARLLRRAGGPGRSARGLPVTPGFEYVAILWGIWRAGGIAVPLPISHPAAELDYLVRDSEASVVIADAENATTLEPLARSTGVRFHLCERSDGPRRAHDLPQPLRRVRQHASAATRRALIVYTSGTTGRPKGVVTTHANLTAQIESLIAAWEWTRDDRTLLVLPLHHVHGIINVVSCALWSGALLEMMPKFECRGHLGSPGVGRTHCFQRSADDLSSADSVLGDGQRRCSAGAVGRLPLAAADDERIRRPSAHRPRSMEGHYRPRAARALRHD